MRIILYTIFIVLALCLLGLFSGLSKSEQNEQELLKTNLGEVAVVTTNEQSHIKPLLMGNEGFSEFPECSNFQDIRKEISTLGDLHSKLNNKVIDIFLNSKKSPYSLESSYRKTGLEIRKFRERLVGDSFNYRNLSPTPLNEGKMHTLKPDVFEQLYFYVEEKNFEKILDLIEKGEVKRNSNFGSKSVLSSILVSDLSIDLSVADKLMKKGLYPDFVDLVFLTESDAPISLVETVLKNGKNIDLTRSWLDNFRYNTLATIAAERLNDDLFLLWVEKGVPLRGREEDLSATDVIGVPKTSEELDKALSILNEIIAADIKPYDYSSYKKLQQWVPASIINTYPNFFAEMNQSARIEDFDDLALQDTKVDEILSFIDELSELELKIEMLKLANQHCYKNKSKSDLEEFSIAELINEETDLILKEITESLVKKDWERYIEIINSLSEKHQTNQIKMMGVNQLIAQNAPAKHIKNLLRNGGKLHSHSIFMLIYNDNVIATEQLLDYGLNLDAKNEKGQTAVDYALELHEQRGNSKMLHFLKQIM